MRFVGLSHAFDHRVPNCRQAKLLAALLVLATTPGALAQSSDTAAPLPAGEVLESQGARIGTIRIRNEDVFDESDPKEARKVFHLINRLHRTTRPAVIERQLLFKPGDLFSPRLLEESERLLRGNRYLYDAKIRPVEYADGRVDLEVDTRDVWTLNLGVGLGRSGGVNSSRFEIQDTNLLGLGKSLTLERASDVDRSTTLLRYDDPALLGSHVKLGLSFGDSSDGSERRIDLGHPFYSLDSRWAAGFTASSDDQVDSLYSLGHITDRFHHQQDLYEVRGGLSHGLVNGRAQRWTAGFTYRRDRFAPFAGLDGLDGLAGTTAPSGSAVPPDRTLAYPWIGFESVEDQYSEVRNVNNISRTEDLYLGTHYSLRLGWSSSLLGSGTLDAAVFDGSAGRGFRLTPRQTLVLSSSLEGRWGDGGAQNLRLGGEARYFWRDFGDNLLFASLSGNLAHDLDPETQLLLGGDSGLRGYPLRYQEGDSRLLLTLEQRFFTDLYPFRLFHVGAAAFLDAGRVWERDNVPGAPGAAEMGWLEDVGVGLRLSSSRSGLGNVIHLDLAFPLDGDPSIQRMQWLVTTSTGF
jgi:outer membrane protein assembly factor BamA